MTKLRTISIPNGMFEENCYLLADEGSADAVIVDPGEEAPRFLERAAREGLVIREGGQIPSRIIAPREGV